MKNKTMYTKTTSTCIFLILSILAFQSTAHSVVTKWERVEESFSDLLNSGWQISGHSSNRAATSPGASGYKPYDEETYTFLLIKNGKYIVCIIANPKPPSNNASCRKLN
jgi:hypothetical protein